FDSTFEFDDAIKFGAVIGYDFGTLRAEAEVTYEKNELKALTVNRVNGEPVSLSEPQRAGVCQYLLAPDCGGSGNTFVVEGSRVRQLTGMVNAWADLPLGPVVPYVGGGIGIAVVELAGERSTNFAWQLGAGV